MKTIFKNKIVIVLLSVLLAVCVVVGAGFSFAKYVTNVDIGTFVLEIIGPPSEYKLTDGATFNSKMAALLSETGNESVTNVVFGSLSDYTGDANYETLKTGWQASKVYLDEEGDNGDGSIRAVVSGDTVYVLTFRNIPLSEKAMFANENSSGMFKHNREAAGTEYATGFIPEGRLTSITGLDKVDTSLVTNMSSMFMFCLNLTELDVKSFDTSKVTDMSYMFRDCTTLTTLDVSSFDTSKVEYMQEMFRYVIGLTTLDLSNFNTSNVINMQGLFHDSTGLTTIEGYEDFDTSNVENMSWMFNNCEKLTSLDLSNFNTAKVTDMQYMFRGCRVLTSITFGDDFVTGNVEDMQHMFHDCYNLTQLDISSFNTAKVTNMAEMFRALYSLTELDLSNFVTTNVTDMSYMFWDLQKVTVLDLSKFDTGSVTNMSGMFGDCASLTTIYVGDGWDTISVETSDRMFDGAETNTYPKNLVGGAGTQWNTSNPRDKTYAVIDGGTAEPGYLTYKVTLTTGTDFNNKIKDLFTTDVTKLRFDNYNAIAAEIDEGTLTLTGLATLWENGTAVDIDEDGDGASDGNIRAFASGDTVYVLSKGYGIIFANEDCSNMFKHSFATGGTTYASGFIPQGQLTAIIGLDKVNTSKVENMKSMFEYCISLAELDVSSFDTSNVTDMSFMFRDCSALTTLDVSGLETSNVTNMQEMFRYIAKVTTLDISTLDTSNVTNMQSMFQDCDALTTITGLGNYSTAAVKNMSYMFNGCDKLSTLTFGVNFKTNAVTTMNSMFLNCSGLKTLDVSGFNTANVTDMAFMFRNCTGLTELNVSSFNTAKVQSLFRTFQHCTGLTELDVTNFNTSNVTDMRHTFRELNITTLDLSTWDTSKVDNMSNMFNDCSKLTTIYVSATGWSTASLTIAESMFYNCQALVGGEGTSFANEQDVHGYNYARIDKALTNGTKGYLTEKGAPGVAQLTTGTAFNTAINSLFSDTVTTLRFGTYDEIEAEINEGTLTLSDSLTTLWESGTFVDVNNTGAIRVFTDTTSGTVYVLSEGSRAIYANADCSYMFAGQGTDQIRNSIYNYLKEIKGLDALNTRKVTNMKSMFSNCSKLTSLDLSGFDTSSVTNMKSMFSNCSKLTSIDVTGFDTSSVTDMSEMFNQCNYLTSLDVSGWDTSGVLNMKNMFSYCTRLTSLDVSGFDTSSVSDMSLMFTNCQVTSLDVSNFDTSSVTNMYQMFQGCIRLTSLDVSGWDTSGVLNMNSMFNQCSALNSLDVTGFDTSSVTNMNSMFNGCKLLTSLDVTGWDTSGVTDMRYMFNDCSGLTSLDLSSFNTSGVTDMRYMFNGCSALEKIYVSDSWTVKNVTSSDNMFSGCTVLEGGEGTTLALVQSVLSDTTNYLTAQYAVIDGGIGSDYPGYLTAVVSYELRPGNFNTAMSSLSPTKIIFGRFNNYAKQFDWDTDGTYIKDGQEIKYFTNDTEPGTVWVLSTGVIKVANTYPYDMFANLTALTKIEGLGRLNTSEVEEMWGWFENCSSLTSVDLSGLDTSSVITMGSMFSGCSSLTSVIVSGIDTSKVDDFSGMFGNCSSLVTLDLSGFDTSSAIYMGGMFNGCTSLTTIYATDWNVSQVNSDYEMFYNCTNLKGGAGTQCDGAISNGTEFAHIDGGESNPGYFTDPEEK